MSASRRYSGRTEQHKAAIHRFRDALALKNAARFRGAMYLAGYAVECRLKARLMEMFGVLTIEELDAELAKREESPRVWTHNLTRLMEHTAAERRLTRSQRIQWGVVQRWAVAWRYAPDNGGERECREFFECVDSVVRFVTTSV